MRFFLRTFGCKSNQYESQAIRSGLTAAGHTEAMAPGEADLLILNSCAVTGTASAAARRAVRADIRSAPTHARIIVTGCAVDLGEAQGWTLPRHTLFVRNAEKHGIARLIAGQAGQAEQAGEDGQFPAIKPDRFALSVSRFDLRTRAFLKIQDGCGNHCAYCAVPRARGTPESRALEEVRAEAGRLTENGHAELVLTGINIGAYSHSGVKLPELVRLLAETPGLARLRLGSVEPPYVTPELVQTMRDCAGVVAPHLHLPLQSGCDATLRRMARRYTSAEFMEKVKSLRDGLANPAITTDVIVAFPGEDEAAFQRTFSLVEEAGFSRLHVFRFSPRNGTPAADLPPVPANVAAERSKQLIRLGEAQAKRFALSCAGCPERVIVESDGTGLTDRYLRARLEEGHGADCQPGTVLPVRLTGVEPGGAVTARRDDDAPGA